MTGRIIQQIAILIGGALAVALCWPGLFGLQDQWVFAHLIAFRLWLVSGGLLVALLCGLVALRRRVRRRVRRVFLTLGILAAFVVASNAVVIAVRGLRADGTGVATAQSNGIAVLSWNTEGEGPDLAVVVGLAVRERADVIVLPETTEAFGVAVAEALRTSGMPMWVHTIAFDHIAKARSTTLLISPRLGDYTVRSETWRGPPANTNTLPTVVADPVSGTGPRIIAVHAVAPVRWELRNWRSDLDWLAAQCSGTNVIMAGDFNSTLDHWSGRGRDGGDLGGCRDAAAQVGSAAVGTWPTVLPAWLGTPIDHVTATPAWRVESFHVLSDFDAAGSDHRPVLARLARV